MNTDFSDDDEDDSDSMRISIPTPPPEGGGGGSFGEDGVSVVPRRDSMMGLQIPTTRCRATIRSATRPISRRA